MKNIRLGPSVALAHVLLLLIFIPVVAGGQETPHDQTVDPGRTAAGPGTSKEALKEGDEEKAEERRSGPTSAPRPTKTLLQFGASQDLTSRTNFGAIEDNRPFDRSSKHFTALPKTAESQSADDGASDLAKKLANPVASLISVPFKSTFEWGLGPNRDGFKYTMNFQPVIPVALNEDWNLISRTILPVIYQSDVVPDTSQFGLGDITQSFFFSPNKAEPFVWGVGPVLLVPTGTSEYLGSQKFGIGPTGLVLKQKGKWTIGFLGSHIWSVAGKASRADLSLSYGQPFLSYTTKTAWTYGVNTESTYEWNSKTAGVPINFTISKLTRLGKRPVSVGAGLKCWVHSTPGGPRNCGFTFTVTPLFPK